MPSIPLYPRPLNPSSNLENPLPQLLHTPTGLALLELQGDIRFPPTPSSPTTQVGKLVFPLYNPKANGVDDTKWMKRAYFYVGENQRMAGEVKKLGRPFAVVRRRVGDTQMGGVEGEGDGRVGEVPEELEIVEVVGFKIVFSSRPEPVGGLAEGGG